MTCRLLLLACLLLAAPADSSSLEEAHRLSVQGDHAAALRIFRQLARSPEAGAAVSSGLARALLLTGQRQEALAVATEARSRHPDSLDVLRAAAAVHAAQGQYAEAIECLQRVLELDPQAAEDAANLGGLFDALGRYDEARVLLRRAAEQAPDNAVTQRRLGAVALKVDDFAAAAQHLQRSAQLQPTSPTTAYLLGRAHEASGADSLALLHYRRAADIDPSYMDAHYRTAQLARRQQHRALADSAMASYARLQRIDDGNADALKRLRLLRDAIVESGEQHEHIYALARFLQQHGYLALARNRYEAVVAANPTHVQALNQLGNLQLQQRDPALALSYYEQVLRLAPGFAPAALNAGNACMLTGQPARALAHFERVCQLAPRMPMGWLGRAAAHMELGRLAQAVDVLEEGLRVAQPQGETRRAFLQKLEEARGQQ